ncbi:hypothetical protein ACFQZJ_06865 [Maribacter chungangensis]|uniref:N-acetyltransferase domain-containing protein n=1 Tax=Maribacter chungangensis TaxID=1069117 RepID=A0ABW3B322_9FLAO
MLESTNSIISEYYSEVNLIITTIAAVSTFLAALFAYRSIRQVATLNKQQALTQIKKSTLEFVSDKNLNLGELSRTAYNSMIEEKNYLSNSVKDIEDNLNLSEYNISLSTKRTIVSKVQSGIPLSYVHGIPYELVENVNQKLIFNGFSEKCHRSMANLFNRLEEVSNAINASLLDLDLFDKMYGGFLSQIYKDHSDWLVYIKRKLGFRFFDQLDVLVNLIFYKSTEFYNLKKKAFLFKLPFLGNEGRSFFVFIIKNWNKLPASIDRKKLIEYSLNHGLISKIDRIGHLTKINSIFIKECSKNGLKKKQCKKVAKLFKDSVESSKGVWPVGVTNDAEDLNKWVGEMQKSWDVSFLAYEKINLRKVLIGFIGISNPATVCLKLSRWKGETTSALKFGLEKGTDIEEQLNKIFIPTVKEEGEVIIDFTKIAMIKSLYVHQKFRVSENKNSIGRKLLRKAINHCRIELNSIPLLTVIADREFTEKAIKLYTEEGGSFLGTCRDGNQKQGHLMHIFVF